jgi:hypothetical protein
MTRDPLFAFGYGLSYTTFKLDNPQVAPAKIDPAGQATVTVERRGTRVRARA